MPRILSLPFQRRRAGQASRVRVLGVNALFHDPSAALAVDGRVVSAATTPAPAR